MSTARLPLTRLAALLAGAALAACADTPTTAARDAAPAPAAARSAPRPAAVADADFEWVGREHNRAIAALRAARRGDRARLDAPGRCRQALQDARRFVRDGQARSAAGATLVVDARAQSLYEAVAERTVGCERGRGASLLDVPGIARALEPSAPALSPAAMALLGEMQAAMRDARGSADVAARFAAIDRRADGLAPGERAILRSGTALGRASAVYAFDTLRLPAARPRSAADGEFIDGEGTLENGGGRDVIEADVNGCIGGAVVGFWLGGPQGAIAGCLSGGLSASIGEIAKQLFW